MGTMTIDKMIMFLATDDALVYRARRTFHIVCVLLGCGIASFLINLNTNKINLHYYFNHKL